jgi:hypothetical protein
MIRIGGVGGAVVEDRSGARGLDLEDVGIAPVSLPRRVVLGAISKAMRQLDRGDALIDRIRGRARGVKA